MATPLAQSAISSETGRDVDVAIKVMVQYDDVDLHGSLLDTHPWQRVDLLRAFGTWCKELTIGNLRAYARIIFTTDTSTNDRENVRHQLVIMEIRRGSHTALSGDVSSTISCLIVCRRPARIMPWYSHRSTEEAIVRFNLMLAMQDPLDLSVVLEGKLTVSEAVQ